MAERPVFAPSISGTSLVEAVTVQFKWYPGFAVSQKQKSVRSLHERAVQIGMGRPLEISTKSEIDIGQALSAFNLKISLESGHRVPVEVAYQASKVFERGGPFPDMLALTSRDAKRDPRLKGSGNLLAFSFEGETWELEPKTSFYDWLYIKALTQNRDLARRLLGYSAFTDIAFNPDKSISCQARSAALFVSLCRRKIFSQAMSDRVSFIQIAERCKIAPVISNSNKQKSKRGIHRITLDHPDLFR